MSLKCRWCSEPVVDGVLDECIKCTSVIDWLDKTAAERQEYDINDEYFSMMDLYAKDERLKKYE